jgi:hypothetical protein
LFLALDTFPSPQESALHKKASDARQAHRWLFTVGRPFSWPAAKA